MFPALILVLCVVLRVVPHPPNLAPVGASAVFAGRTLKPFVAVLLVAASMFVGDVILARVQGYAVVSVVTPFTYGGVFVQALLGRVLRSRKGGAIAAAAAGSVVFFVVSNFGVWVAGTTYAQTQAGLVECYAAALPFFGRTLLSDVGWTLVLSLAYRPLATRFQSREHWVPVPARELALL